MPPGTEWRKLKDVLSWTFGPDYKERTNFPDDGSERKHKIKRRFVYVRGKKGFIEIGARSLKQLMDKEQFSDRFARSCSTEIAKQPRKWAQLVLAELDTVQVDDVAYRPGHARFIWEYDGRFCINLWRPSPVIPIEDIRDSAEP